MLIFKKSAKKTLNKHSNLIIDQLNNIIYDILVLSTRIFLKNMSKKTLLDNGKIINLICIKHLL